jgi:hypothetical protein
MVVYTPITPRTMPTANTPYEALDTKIATLTTQMELMMRQFNTLAANSLNGGSIASHDLTSDQPAVVSPSPLAPTPTQGPPPPVASSNVSLIADKCEPKFHFATLARSRSAIPATIGLDFCPPEDSCHKNQALGHEDLYVSGYYYLDDEQDDTPPTDDQCVAWLSQSLEGPYAGKQDQINKLSFTLTDDTLTGFMKFNTAL